MALSDLTVFSDHAYSTATEVLMQQIELFNAATNNTIVLSSKANTGDYSELAFWKKLNGLVRRRNAYDDGTGTVAAIDLEHLLDTSVKIAAGTPPVNIPQSQMNWIQRSPEEAGAVVGQQLAIDMMADMLNAGIIAGRSALSQVAGVNFDGTAATVTTKTMNPKQLNAGSRLFGDQAQSIVAWIMHSTQVHDFYDNAIDNQNRLFTYGTINVVSDPMGRVFVVSDAPGLLTAGDPNNYHAMGLTPGAIVVEENNDFIDNLETSNGGENIARTYQAEWSYNVGIKGFAWDKASGGASPNDAALAVATNWDKYSTDDKSLAGVVVTTL